MTAAPDAIQQGLRRIRRAKRVMAGLFIGFIPVGILSGVLSEATHLNILFFLGAYLALVLLCDTYFGLTSTCPLCNELYYWRMTGLGYRSFLAKRCLNCGLELEERKQHDGPRK
jgi:uncharacterized membrane protein YqaE (UPF0057 family)